MIDLVVPNIYRIEIPLPNNPLRTLNSYLIKDEDRNLLIDTGFNLEACRNAMDQALQELEISMDDTDLFITHVHSDHAGLVYHLNRPGNTIWMGEPDAKLMDLNQKEDLFNKNAAQLLIRSGLLVEGVPNLPGEEAISKFAVRKYVDIAPVYEGDCFDKGGYHFKALATPGHTIGHMCLYEAEHKLLIAGDHILTKITPNIGMWRSGHDFLGLYLESLDKTSVLEVDLVLPGHRSYITDMQGRTEELKLHHARRLQQILDVLGNEKMSPARVARGMKWDLSYKTWEEFPINQKMHATAEALSHLYHLMIKGQLDMVEEEGIYYFSKTK